MEVMTRESEGRRPVGITLRRWSLQDFAKVAGMTDTKMEDMCSRRRIMKKLLLCGIALLALVAAPAAAASPAPPEGEPPSCIPAHPWECKTFSSCLESEQLCWEEDCLGPIAYSGCWPEEEDPSIYCDEVTLECVWPAPPQCVIEPWECVGNDPEDREPEHVTPPYEPMPQTTAVTAAEGFQPTVYRRHRRHHRRRFLRGHTL